MTENKKKKSYKRGILAEYIAAFYLVFKGYHIIRMRYKAPVGEIDIIARRRNTLVFVEVKYRRSLEDAISAVGARSQRRIEKSALHFISFNKRYQTYDMRFDVIGIEGLWPFSLKHLDNAWLARS